MTAPVQTCPHRAECWRRWHGWKDVPFAVMAPRCGYELRGDVETCPLWQELERESEEEAAR